MNNIFDLNEVMATTFTQIRITITNVTNQQMKNKCKAKSRVTSYNKINEQQTSLQEEEGYQKVKDILL